MKNLRLAAPHRMAQFTTSTLLVAVLVLAMGGCTWSWDLCSGDNEEETCAADVVALISLLNAIKRVPPATPSDPEDSRCSTSVSAPQALSTVRVGSVVSGQSCYYRYEIFYESGDPGPFSPAFRLVPEIGNVDLYVGYDNDSTGGTPGYTACAAATSGGGWVGCSRLPGNSEDQVLTNRSGVASMSSGDYRIIAVHNPGSTLVEFAVLGLKKGLEAE